MKKILLLLVSVFFICLLPACNNKTDEVMRQVTESDSDFDYRGQISEIYSPSDDELVVVNDFIPDVICDLKYASSDNFTGQIIYDSNVAYLRYGTVKKLIKVQNEARTHGYSIVIWDAYRPVDAQFKLWEICPDSRFVANPNKGYSSHSRGNTVDITLADKEGNPIPMPTDFDDFTKRAGRDYSLCTETEKENALYLENIMIDAGFIPYQAEWWHFSDEDKYEVVEY